MELHFGERLRKYRRERDLTQEELAQVIGISPQSISKWERNDGYPDITLLPRIANYFEITIDTLLGNDPSNDDTIWEEYRRKRDEVWMDNEERLKVDLAYYHNYPKSCYVYSFALDIAYTISLGMQDEQLKQHLPLLKEVCERTINECTVQGIREGMIRSMCTVCIDEDFEKWYTMCVDEYSSIQGEVLEERLWRQEKRDESRLRYAVNNLNLILHFMTRETRSWGGRPERSAELNQYRMKFMEFLGGGTVPEAWLLLYARSALGSACALFGSGKKEEGYEDLEKALGIFKKWNSIACDTAMDVGSDAFFGGVKIVKNKRIFLLPDGTEEYMKKSWWFWEKKDEMYSCLTQTSGWEWFDCVREERRFKEYVEKARLLA
ncbi:MAG: helix-turn-helix domain-containing protein [Eubacteriales bacterium]